MKLFGNWRDFMFEDNVNAAIKRGVRYAGMGLAHLNHLQDIGLPAGAHAYDMTSSGAEMLGFITVTYALKVAAALRNVLP